MRDAQTLSGERALTSCCFQDRSDRTVFFKGGVGVVRFQFRQRLTDRVERLGLFFGMIVFVSDWLMGSRRSGFEAEDGRCTSMKSVEEREDDVRVFRDEVEDRVRASIRPSFSESVSRDRDRRSRVARKSFSREGARGRKEEGKRRKSGRSASLGGKTHGLRTQSAPRARAAL